MNVVNYVSPAFPTCQFETIIFVFLFFSFFFFNYGTNTYIVTINYRRGVLLFIITAVVSVVVVVTIVCCCFRCRCRCRIFATFIVYAALPLLLVYMHSLSQPQDQTARISLVVCLEQTQSNKIKGLIIQLIVEKNVADF